MASERVFRDDDGVVWTASEVSGSEGGTLDRQGRRITPVDGYRARLLFSSDQGIVLMLDPPPDWREASDDELRLWLRTRRRGGG